MNINIDMCYCHDNTLFYPNKTILANISINLVDGYINTHYDDKLDLKIKLW